MGDVLSARVTRCGAPGHVSFERAPSRLGLASRSEARALIQDGRVRVGGRPAADPLAPVVPERIHIEIDGRAAERVAPVMVLLHKPRGVVTTRPILKAGRRSMAVWKGWMRTSSRWGGSTRRPPERRARVYLVTVRGELSDATAQHLQEGISAEGDLLSARTVTVRKRSWRETHLVVELTEGKNREVWRMMKAAGHQVSRLNACPSEDWSWGAWNRGDGGWSRRTSSAAFPGAPERPARAGSR